MYLTAFPALRCPLAFEAERMSGGSVFKASWPPKCPRRFPAVSLTTHHKFGKKAARREGRALEVYAQRVCHCGDVLIATAAQVDENEIVRGKIGGQPRGINDRVR